ncbi:TerB family tellurite resistance protein [Celeribacter sp.]|uniref:tellurite resistance TerB family protein n=1 Tax=Celeribacter sp. TaxID=1890673 RepID=UPI003A8DFE09
MFAEFLKKLVQPNPPRLADVDARLALAALLVRVARADGQYDPAEIEKIETVLKDRYGLPPAEATTLRTQAETLEEEAPDTVRFTRAIKDAVPYEDRESVIEGLWAVVLADGTRDHDEDTLLRLVANLLGVNDRDSALARQRVEAKQS